MVNRQEVRSSRSKEVATSKNREVAPVKKKLIPYAGKRAADDEDDERADRQRSRRQRQRAERPTVTDGIRPIRERLTQAARIEYLVEDIGIEGVGKKEVRAVLDAYRRLIVAHVMPKGVGVFSEPGYFTVVAKQVPARVKPAIKAGLKKVNPFTGEEFVTVATPAKKIPATVKARAKAQRKLKEAVLGQ